MSVLSSSASASVPAYVITFTLRNAFHSIEGTDYSYTTGKSEEATKEAAVELWDDMNDDDDYSNLMRNF